MSNKQQLHYGSEKCRLQLTWARCLSHKRINTTGPSPAPEANPSWSMKDGASLAPGPEDCSIPVSPLTQAIAHPSPFLGCSRFPQPIFASAWPRIATSSPAATAAAKLSCPWASRALVPRLLPQRSQSRSSKPSCLPCSQPVPPLRP